MHGERKGRRSALRDPRFSRVVAAFMGFRLGEAGMWMASLVYVFDRGGIERAGFFAVAGFAVAMVVAPLAAFAGDRFRTDRAMAASHAVQAVLALATGVAVVAGYSLAAEAGMVALSGAFTLTRPIVGAMLPAITKRPAELVQANVTIGVVESSCVVAGPLLTAALLSWGGAETVFFLFGAAGLAGVALTFDLGLEGSAHGGVDVDRHGVAEQVLGGLRAIRTDYVLGLLVTSMSAGALAIGATDVLALTQAEELSTSADTLVGMLYAAVGVGSIVGSFLAPRLLSGHHLMRPFAVGVVGVSVPFLAMAGAERAAVVLAAYLLVGLGDSSLRISGAVAMQRLAPRNLLVRMFGINESLRMAGMCLGALAVPLLVEWLGLESALVVIGAGILLVAGLGVLLLSTRLRRLTGPPAEVVDRLVHDPIFESFDVLQAEALGASAERKTVAAGSVLVRQGEPGADYQLIVDGTVAIDIDGDFVRRMGPGDAFGEIALLRDIPRTATVVAETEVRLILIERSSFLEAVTGHPQTSETAEDVVDKWLSGDNASNPSRRR